MLHICVHLGLANLQERIRKMEERKKERMSSEKEEEEEKKSDSESEETSSSTVSSDEVRTMLAVTGRHFRPLIFNLNICHNGCIALVLTVTIHTCTCRIIIPYTRHYYRKVHLIWKILSLLMKPPRKHCPQNLPRPLSQYS